MAEKKNKRNRYNENEDYQDINRGGQRKQQRKNKRHSEKRHLKDVQRGEIDPDDYQDYIESGW